MVDHTKKIWSNYIFSDDLPANDGEKDVTIYSDDSHVKDGIRDIHAWII